MSETYRKINDRVLIVTTTSEPVINEVERDRAEIQTELDHIPDRLAELQKQIDEVNGRKDKLTRMLGVFK